MKKSIVFFLFAISLIAIYSCSDDSADDTMDGSINNVNSVLEQAKNRILSMVLDTTDMVEIDGYYVVENDILINKDSLFSVPQTRQYSATNTVATGQVITIGVNNSSLLTAWASALDRVVSNYSNYTGMVFKFNGYDPDADIVVSKEFLYPSNVCAEGEFPVTSNGKPGKHVRINSAFYKDIDAFLTTAEKEFLMMHEIGHNLGLRHTNCAVNGEGTSDVGMVKIPGTPDKDSKSYMNSATCGNSWNGMPKYDAVALNYLFPVVYSTIHFENCTGVSDIKFKKGSEYELSRKLIPQKEGYVFAGWHHTDKAYSPFSYDYKITSDKVLYARWTNKGTPVTVECISRDRVKTKTFELKRTAVVTFSSKIEKSANTWMELTMHQGTYSKLERIDGIKEFSLVFDIKDVGAFVFDKNPYYFVKDDTFVLEEGVYMLTSSLTTELGEQNYSSGKHGIVTTTISYY